MNDSSFHFKQFIVRQDKCAMKVGTDAVLLGSWVSRHELNSVKTILDIGTGTGIIAMMLAQKSEAKIDAIDIDDNAVMQAKDNVNASIWKDKISIHKISLQDYSKEADQKFDLIISNPPYFDETFKPAEEGRNKARHTDNLSFEDLADGVRILLSEHGKFYVILPLTEGTIFIEKMRVEGLFLNEIMRVKSRKEKPEKRLMMQFSFHKTEVITTELFIHEDDNAYSEAYIEMTKDYYL